ncbi:Leucine-rich repeat domain-containing protein [Pseudomonas sp. IT-232MI5]|uniref:leucine-rich repeat domain-containing protein n=1 Tax=unclassified Pseudomonas TaxID=196821 RepID=UPI000BA30345|nr:leucine-rich repeat domain-containing protein [Pseudomonas sp. Irchel 3H7]
MAGKPPKIKPALSRTDDFSAGGSQGLPRSSQHTPSSLAHLDAPFPLRRSDIGAAAQSVSVSPMAAYVSEVEMAVSASSFRDYWIQDWKNLGDADASGIRLYKQRLFVAVADDYFVQVVQDAESGQFRATVASELNASGPLMKPGAEGKFWRPADSDGLPGQLAQEHSGAWSGDGNFQVEPLRTIDERLAVLYPTLTEEARADLHRERLSADTGQALARLEVEHLTLVKDLGAWAVEVPSLHPVTGQALTITEIERLRSHRALFAQELQANWSRQLTTANPYTPEKLDYVLDMTGTLPRLSADFSHVRELSLSGTYVLSGSAFLAAFPGVQHLTLTGLALKAFPVEIFQMRELTTLTLDNCDIRLSEATVEGLAHIEGLTLLDLSNNPLGLPPDVSYMRRLDSLYLSKTGLTEVPVGIFDIESLAYVDFRHNGFTSLPRELFDVPDVREVNYDFRNNPLDDDTLQRITAYFDGAGLDRRILIQVDGDVWVPQQNIVSDGVDSGLESADEG